MNLDVPNSESRGHAWASPYSHGEAGRGRRSTEWLVWIGIIKRCLDPKCKIYPYYGGRGVRVCERWVGKFGYETFLADVGRRPAGLQLDRIDNDGDYEPGNVRWATRSENMRNTRRARIVQIDGVSLPLKTWCERLNLPYKTVHQRIKVQGLDPVEALTRPIGRTK